MKKKIAVFVVIAAMLLALTACGGNASASAETSAAQAAAEETTAAETTTAEETTAEETTVVEETAEEETSAEAEAETSIFELGSTHGLVYENESLGIGCKLPTGWVAYDEDQIAELNGIVLDNVDESIKEQLESASYIYDMMAAEEDGANNINVIVQNLTALQAIAFSSSPDAVETALEQSEADLVSTLENMGAENVTFKIDRAQTFPAENYACAEVKGEVMGVELTERIAMFKSGNHLVNITAAAFGEDITGELLDSFYAIK